MMNNLYDPDDIRNRSELNKKMRPHFHWVAIYNTAQDNYELKAFMRIHNGDETKDDIMTVQVSQKHIAQFNENWQKFFAEQGLERTVYTRDEMMNIISFRNKINYNKSIILLPPENPMYNALISDFSLELTKEDIFALKQVDGVVEQSKIEEETPQGKTTQEKLFTLMEYALTEIKKVSDRLTQLEERKNNV